MPPKKDNESLKDFTAEIEKHVARTQQLEERIAALESRKSAPDNLVGTIEILESRLEALERFVEHAFQLQAKGVDRSAKMEVNPETGKAEVKED